MNQFQFEENEEALNQNVSYRHRRWWRRDATVSAVLLGLLSAIALVSGIGLVIASYIVLCPPQ